MSTPAALYLRISKHDPKIPKVEVQEALCRELADRHDLKVVAVYVDDGISASKVGKMKMKERPDWIRMLDDVEAGKFKVLLAQAEDRFSREPLEKEVLDDLAAKSGITYLTHQDGATDPSKASGRLGSGIKALVARYYVASASEKHRDGNDGARKRGEPARGGDRPFGYLPDKKTLDPFESALVKRAYEDVASGAKTPTGIAHAWNRGIKSDDRHMRTWVRTSRGGRWTAPGVAALLRRERNAGWQTHKGKRVELDEGAEVQWKPIVDEALFLAARKALDDSTRGLTRAHEPKWLCSGIAICASCDTPLASNTNARGAKYRCRVHNGEDPRRTPTGKHVEIVCSIIDEVVTKAAVDAVLFAPRSAGSDPDTNKLRALRGRLADLNAATARLVRAIEEGAMEPGDVAPRRKEIAAESAKVEQDITDIASANVKADLLSDVSLFLTNKTSLADAAEQKSMVRERFDKMPLDQRRAFISGFLRIEVTPGGRGADRVRITHLVATTLNDADQYIEDQAV